MAYTTYIAIISTLTITMIVADMKDPVEDLDLRSEAVLKEKWDEYKSAFKKNYKTPEEDEYRFHVFSDNINQIQIWNDQAMERNKYGITKYADLTKEEMYRHTGFVPDEYAL
ncbi:unnamed protein product [Bemisia tabaci]|uniref:Cathepsin propeptide inhibitor domain-containing protein n=2 Tax=Bemisia tabaci TaxID=7038 RepID=A0A9P0CD30_BEMTA|nr:unnamed protein product [Bemisia tabaci]